MSSKTLFLASLVLLLGAARSANGQEAEAKESLKELKKLPLDLAKSFGFASKIELDASTLGIPIKVYMLPLNALEKFKKGDSPTSVLLDNKHIVYPVYSGGTFRTSISLLEKKGKWRESAIGGENIHIIEPARKKHAAQAGNKESDYFLVKVPAMYLVYLGIVEKKTMYLVPSHKHADLTFTLHKELPAEQVLLALKPLAKKYEKATAK